MSPLYVYVFILFCVIIFSLPELKAKVTFLIRLLSVCLSVRPSVNFSHFQHLFQNHLTNFNQILHKAPLGKWNSKFWKLRISPFTRGDNYWTFLWNFQKCSSQEPFSQESWSLCGSILTKCKFKIGKIMTRGRVRLKWGSNF